jgi:hypothetical protein
MIVCCLVPDGLETDILAQHNDLAAAAGPNFVELHFYPSGEVPDGYFFYVCPDHLAYELIASGSKVPGNVMAYGPKANAPFALDAGFCDFLTEPWDYAELMARIRRRWSSCHFRFSWGEIYCDGQNTELNGVALKYAPGFHRFMRFMAINAGKILSRKNVLLVMGQRNPNSRVLDQYAVCFRKAYAGICGDGRQVLSCLRNKGYLLSL